MVFVTKYRREILDDGVFKYMEGRLKAMNQYHPEVDILEINHDKDHIHMLVSIPPKFSVGKVVRILKSNTARDLKKKFEFLKEVYWGTDSVWSGGYFVSTVGIDEDTVRRYIQMQGKEDAGQAKLEL